MNIILFLFNPTKCVCLIERHPLHPSRLVDLKPEYCYIAIAIAFVNYNLCLFCTINFVRLYCISLIKPTKCVVNYHLCLFCTIN